MSTRIYIQSEFFHDIKLVEVDENASIEELKIAVIDLLPEEISSSDVTIFVEDDVDDALAHVTHVKDLKKEHGIRLHIHRCKHVEVQVRYGAQALHHQFSPAMTVGHVRLWAGKKLGMAPGDVAEHVLQISGSSEQPDVDIHIGTLTKYPSCTVSFDLVPAHRING